MMQDLYAGTESDNDATESDAPVESDSSDESSLQEEVEEDPKAKYCALPKQRNELLKKTVPELAKMLREQNLPVGGTKQTQIDRLAATPLFAQTWYEYKGLDNSEDPTKLTLKICSGESTPPHFLRFLLHSLSLSLVLFVLLFRLLLASPLVCVCHSSTLSLIYLCVFASLLFALWPPPPPPPASPPASPPSPLLPLTQTWTQ